MTESNVFTFSCPKNVIMYLIFFPIFSTFQMKCPFNMKFKLSGDGNSLVITSLDKNHNHAINEAPDKNLPRKRKVDSDHGYVRQKTWKSM